MVKKRLSDLLQEEVQKSPPTEGEVTIEATATPVDQPVDEVEEEASLSAEEDPTPTVEHTTAKRTHPTKAELEVIVKELTQTVEQAHQNESELGQKIVDLQSALSEQKELVEHLKKELSEAKQAAVYLAEHNSQLTEEINTLKQKTKNSSSIIHKRLYREPEDLPKTQPGESEDASSQMWLLD